MTEVEILVDSRMSDDSQTEPLRFLLTDLGFDPRTRVLPTRRSGDTLTWVALLSLPLTAFVSALSGHLAQDTYQRLKQAIVSFRARGRQALDPDAEPAPLVIQDSATGLQIILPPDLPEDGYRKLLALDLSIFRMGPLRYDATQGCWRSDLDEATR